MSQTCVLCDGPRRGSQVGMCKPCACLENLKKRKPIDHLSLFRQKYVVIDSGCWQWTACVNNQGYGRFRQAGKGIYAHRYSYSVLVGPIPDGLTIDHLCRNKLCVNPAHLEPVTLVENIRRAHMKTHCIRGHAFVPENIYLRPDTGGRQCRSCARSRVRTKVAA